MFGAILDLVGFGAKEVAEHFKSRRRLKEAEVDNRIRMLQSKQDHNQNWEMRALMNAGWKDEVLFIAILSMYVYSAFDPEGAKRVFEIWSNVIPEWYQKITFWLVASILGVKKIGDYAPMAIHGIGTALKSLKN